MITAAEDSLTTTQQYTMTTTDSLTTQIVSHAAAGDMFYRLADNFVIIPQLNSFENIILSLRLSLRREVTSQV